jgi:nitrous oxide reductase
MRSSIPITRAGMFAIALLAATPAFSANRVVYLQTVVWVSKENPAQKRTVAKYGESYGFWPSTITVRQGDHVTLHIRNLEAGGDDDHTFTVPKYHINESLPPLSTKTISFTAR